MSTTPNLAIPHILQSQAQKEVTANAAFDALDGSANRALTLALADADLTFLAEQANRYGLIILTGALTEQRTVTLPANHRRLALRNATTGGWPVIVRYPGAGADVAILPDVTALLQGDGVYLYGVAGAAPRRSPTLPTSMRPAPSMAISCASMAACGARTGAGCTAAQPFPTRVPFSNAA